MKRFQVFALLGLSLAACGGGAGADSNLDTSNRDPRCVAACPATMPQYAGVGAVCDTQSRGECLDLCEARIAGLPTLCQSCLLENACFGPDGCFGSQTGGSCDQTSCTLQSEFGTCTYRTDDQAAKLACMQKVDPRRDVACTPSFQPTTKCSSVCP
ncbi:MAG: hypothetical protein ABJE66_06290 [Deltaproteobacteria bacterium]